MLLVPLPPQSLALDAFIPAGLEGLGSLIISSRRTKTIRYVALGKVKDLGLTSVSKVVGGTRRIGSDLVVS